MINKSFLTLSFFLIFTVFIVEAEPQSENIHFAYSKDLRKDKHNKPMTSGENPTENIISNYQHFSLQQLFDTANYYYKKNSIDTALIYYNLFISFPIKENDVEQQKMIVKVFNRIAIIYYYRSQYYKAYELLIEGLFICEKYNLIFEEPRILLNMGNIYSRFRKYDVAKLYYIEALGKCQDSTYILGALANMGFIELENGDIDSAFYLLNKSLQISERHNNIHLSGILNMIALCYKKTKQYDLAVCYFKLSLEEAINKGNTEDEVENLSSLGKVFFEINKIDSALFYINLSNSVAAKNGILRILADNNLTMSKIEKSKGNYKSALEYYTTYSNLRDSVFDVKIFGDIDQLQRLYEVSKTDKQIEQLFMEHEINEETIYYQKVVMFVIFLVLLLISGILWYVFSQKRSLDMAYKILFEKNLELFEFQQNSSVNEGVDEKQNKKYRKSALTDDVQNELFNKILAIMEDSSVICDTEFSLVKLAELVQSNQTYVSQVINTVLKKNFRSFLNGYRVREAQRLFLEFDASKYTIESMALRIGFKSPHAFRTIFKEITGVSPNFYLKSIKEQQKYT